MKEEDLIKKIKNVELPDIKIESHRRRLKMALLDTDYLKKRRENTIWEPAKSTLKGVRDTMIRGLVSRQPVWKTATVGVLAVGLVLGLSLTIPSLTADSVYAQASEIVRNSPEVHKVLGDDEVIEVTIVNIEDHEGTVIAKSETGTISAMIDLNTNSVSQVAIIKVDEQRAIEIARADPGVQALLNSGATIGDVSTMFVCGEMGNVKTGETEGFSETFVMVEITGSEKFYTAYIDMDEGRVTKLTETSPDTIRIEPPAGSAEINFHAVPDTEAVSDGENNPQ
jgi:hypothetical protein